MTLIKLRLPNFDNKFHEYLQLLDYSQVESCAIAKNGLRSHIHILRANHDEAIVQISACPQGGICCQVNLLNHY